QPPDFKSSMSTDSITRACQTDYRIIIHHICYTLAMKQIVIIHGGNSFDSYQSYRQYLDAKTLNYDKLLYRKGWQAWLAEQLPESDVILPAMPNNQNAVYDEWVVYFEKLQKFFTDDVRLIG